MLAEATCCAGSPRSTASRSSGRAATPDYLSLDALLQTAQTLQVLGANRYRVLITKVPPRPRRDGEEAKALLEKAGLPLFRTLIRRFSVFEDAAAFGVPVSEMKSHYAHEGWNDYQAAW